MNRKNTQYGHMDIRLQSAPLSCYPYFLNMKILALIMLLTISGIVHAADSQQKWSMISPGNYIGYGEFYIVDKGYYTIGTDALAGDRCEFYVSDKGITYMGILYPWDLPGVQASREPKKGENERIYVIGKFGGVVVVDFNYERPKGKIRKIVRMSVAPAPTEKEEKNNPRDNQ